MRKFFMMIFLGSYSFYLWSLPSEVVNFDWSVRDGKALLRVSVPEGFGIQKDAPHSFLFSPSPGVSISKSETKLSGPVDSKKPEYFEFVKPLALQVSGKGQLQMSARVYYCDYKKGICIHGKFQKTFDIP